MREFSGPDTVPARPEHRACTRCVPRRVTFHNGRTVNQDLSDIAFRDLFACVIDQLDGRTASWSAYGDFLRRIWWAREPVRKTHIGFCWTKKIEECHIW